MSSDQLTGRDLYLVCELGKGNCFRDVRLEAAARLEAVVAERDAEKARADEAEVKAQAFRRTLVNAFRYAANSSWREDAERILAGEGADVSKWGCGAQESERETPEELRARAEAAEARAKTLQAAYDERGEELSALTARFGELKLATYEDLWIWMGNGEDDPQPMGDAMEVVVQAAQIRNWIAAEGYCEDMAGGVEGLQQLLDEITVAAGSKGLAWLELPQEVRRLVARVAELESSLEALEGLTEEDLAAWAAVQSGAWQPIETAPKDRWVLAKRKGRDWVVLAKFTGLHWRTMGCADLLPSDLELWHELPPFPAPPQAASEGGEVEA